MGRTVGMVCADGVRCDVSKQAHMAEPGVWGQQEVSLREHYYQPLSISCRIGQGKPYFKNVRLVVCFGCSQCQL